LAAGTGGLSSGSDAGRAAGVGAGHCGGRAGAVPCCRLVELPPR